MDDLIGRVFSRLKVMSFSHKGKGEIYWKCKCSCGGNRIISNSVLMTNHVHSCGCFRKESIIAVGKSNKKHGYSNTRIYHIWTAMKSRCENINKKSISSMELKG